jgi:ribosomal protein S18 acetylase RimI-like enzyme
MNFIRADRSHIGVLVDLRIAYLLSDGELSESERDNFMVQIKDFFNRHLNIDCECFLAQDKKSGEFVSVVVMIECEKPANRAFKNGKTAMLMNVYTKPSHRRRGIASNLLDMVISYTKSREISCIDLSATVMGRPLYEKHGFKTRGNGNSEMRLKL